MDGAYEVLHDIDILTFPDSRVGISLFLDFVPDE